MLSKNITNLEHFCWRWLSNMTYRQISTKTPISIEYTRPTYYEYGTTEVVCTMHIHNSIKTNHHLQFSDGKRKCVVLFDNYYFASFNVKQVNHTLNCSWSRLSYSSLY